MDVEVALEAVKASLLQASAVPVADEHGGQGATATPAATNPSGAQRLHALIVLDDKVHATYLALRERLLFSGDMQSLPPAPMVAKSRRVFAELTALFAQCTSVLATDGPDRAQLPMLAARAFRNAAEHLKWTAFEHVAPAGTFWLGAHRLYQLVESRGVHQEEVDLYSGTAAARTTCADAYAQCVLLGTLNVGILTPVEIEMGHRWLVDMVRDQALATMYNERIHTHCIRFDSARGAVRITDSVSPDPVTRFLAGSSLEPGLNDTRKYLYSGALTARAANPSIAALHYGAFLDLAERLWSPEWRRLIQRAPRESVAGATIEAVLGLDRIVAAIDAAQEEAPPAPEPASERADGLEIDWPDGVGPKAGASNVIDLPGRSSARWQLRDRSETGMGALVPGAAATAIPVGALIGVREGADADWGVGMMVRKLAAAESSETLLGIKRLSESPVHVRLFVGTSDPRTAAPIDALFAPMQTKHSRIDALIIPVQALSTSDQCSLRVGADLYQIHLDRILDRGDGWVRVGFEILGKVSTPAR